MAKVIPESTDGLKAFNNRNASFFLGGGGG